MEPLASLLATDERQALEFFFVGLKDVSEPDVDLRELLYNASVLAHYAQVSVVAGVELPTPRSLMDVFDHFVVDAHGHHDSDLLEIAATQCLLLAGFFESQMQRRHSIRWYTDLGAGFFRRAAALQPSGARADLLEVLGRRFDAWRRRYSRLSRELRVQRYVIPPAT